MEQHQTKYELGEENVSADMMLDGVCGTEQVMVKSKALVVAASVGRTACHDVAHDYWLVPDLHHAFPLRVLVGIEELRVHIAHYAT